MNTGIHSERIIWGEGGLQEIGVTLCTTVNFVCVCVGGGGGGGGGSGETLE